MVMFLSLIILKFFRPGCMVKKKKPVHELRFSYFENLTGKVYCGMFWLILPGRSESGISCILVMMVILLLKLSIILLHAEEPSVFCMMAPMKNSGEFSGIR